MSDPFKHFDRAFRTMDRAFAEMDKGFSSISWPMPQQGCICPPTSEKTCQAPTCPRKPIAKP